MGLDPRTYMVTRKNMCVFLVHRSRFTWMSDLKMFGSLALVGSLAVSPAMKISWHTPEN